MSTTTWTFDAGTDLVVIGCNPEMADYDNRRGEIYGYSAYVRACNEHGDTRVLHIETDRVEANVLPLAEEQAAALNKRMASGRLPVGFDRLWREGRAMYGTAAWEDYGNDEQLAFERECE